MIFDNPVNVTPYLLRQLFATFASSLLSTSCGLNFGVTSVMLPQLHNDTEFNYDEYYDSWIASITVLSMIIGSVSVGTILDVYGRKMAHILLSIPYMLGWIFIGFATSPTYILIGRFITGISTGANRPLTLVYIGEISDPRYRDLTLLIPSFFTMLGSLLSHVLGAYFHWRTAAFIMLVPAVLGFIVNCFIKESPLWLIAKGQMDEASDTFRWFRGTDVISEMELSVVLDRQVKSDDKSSIKEVVDVMLSRSFIKPFLILMILMVNLQFSGVNVINFYAQDLFDRMFGGRIDSFGLMMATDAIRIISVFAVCAISNLVCRKKLYIMFNVGIIVSLTVMVAFMAFNVTSNEWIFVMFTITYIVTCGGIVTIGWAFVPEVLPNRVRGIGSGLMSGMAFIMLFVGVKIVPDMIKYYGPATLYGIFDLLTLLSIVVLVFTLPKTKGKTLQSIEDSYNNHVESSLS